MNKEEHNKCSSCVKATESIKIDIGYTQMTYKYANFINAVESLAQYFMVNFDCDNEKLAECLELYSKHLKGE
jgi:hypothetical protein